MVSQIIKSIAISADEITACPLTDIHSQYFWEVQESKSRIRQVMRKVLPVALWTEAKSSVIWAIRLELADWAALFLANPHPTAVARLWVPISVFTRACVLRSLSSISAFREISWHTRTSSSASTKFHQCSYFANEKPCRETYSHNLIANQPQEYMAIGRCLAGVFESYKPLSSWTMCLGLSHGGRQWLHASPLGTESWFPKFGCPVLPMYYLAL